MQTLAQIAIYVINSLGTLYVTLVLLRFLLQLVRADYYNPISKSIAKLTSPLLIPLRKVIPGLFGIDLAALILAIVLEALLIQIIGFIGGLGFINPFTLLIWAIVALLGVAISLYFIAVIVVFIASWIAPYSHNPALSLLRQLVDPLIAPFRKIVPPIGGLDLSSMLFFIVLQIVRVFLFPKLAGMVAIPSIFLFVF
jgi:YggT family protein